jgi:hypothetical protein
MACMIADFAGVRIDVPAALAMAQALGAAPDVAADLVAAITAGMTEARAKQAKERPE